ncbi:sulfur carrier protein [Desulfonatronum thiosulfatophilum]|uniref:Sulfur carrier protein n=1 Tax=Desulfonatronum thiosulfatophilum TaxID=617002 RepID=A0A1G6C747_9BACT|nr:sulfur carrier protein ThiS [Desulfonatronum thiosulfatophilum]SDB28641.1 sulfur carrier protein [Desulfonatronum thiosulfatophilum]
MHILINGINEHLTAPLTLQELITSKGLDPAVVVAELNREIIPGEQFSETTLREGDHLELLRFVGGG